MFKTMRTVFIALCLSVGLLEQAAAASQVNPASITSIDVSGLTAEQKTALLSQVSKLQEPKSDSNISATVRDEAAKWTDMGTNMGKATVALAKEIGVAANEFIQTPMGKLTVGLVVFKVMGSQLLGVLIGSAILVFFLAMALYFVLCKKLKNVTYDYKPVLFGLFNRRVVTSCELDGDLMAAHMIFAAISTAIGLILGLTTIF